MALLTFIRSRKNLTAAAEAAPEDAKPFLLLRDSDIPAAIEALAAGRDTLALAAAAQHGWHAPEGTEVKLHDDMQHDGLEAMRHQCEGRIHRAGKPVQIVTIDASGDFDGYLARMLERKGSGAKPGRGSDGHDAAVSDYTALLAALESAPRKSDFRSHYREHAAVRQPQRDDEDEPSTGMGL